MITSILSTDLISSSRDTLNDNFNTLNVNKVETSVFSALSSVVALKNSVSVSSVVGSVLSVTTTDDDTLLVQAKGFITGSASAGSVALLYNGAVRDSVSVKQAATADTLPFFLTYYEKPGAATANIQTSVIANGGLSIGDLKIIATKIN